MFSLIPVLALLATANAVAIDRSGAQVEKRGCLGDPLGLIPGFCNTPVATTTAKTTVATTTTKAVVPTTTAAAPTTTAAAPTTTVKATNGTTTATTAAGNVVNSVVAVPVAVVSQVITCPLDPLGVLNLCGNGNAGTTTAATTTAVATTKATTAAGTATTAASNPVNTVASVVNSIITCPFGVVGLDGLCPTAPATTVAATTKATTVAGTATTAAANPINTVASVVNSIITCPFGVVGLDGLCPTAPATTVVATTTAKATTPASSSTTAAASSSSSSASSIIASVSSSSAASSSSAVTSTSSATPSASATPVNPTVSGWAYQAVVAEGTGGRALTGSTYAGSSMTVESCLAFCDNAGFPLAGLEYSSECYCGSSLSNGASLTKTATGGMVCSGNANELCGGSSALSLYRSTKSNGAGLNSDLTSQAVALPAGWSSTTCMQEVSGRAFTKKSLVANDMTIQKCLSFCGDSKYAGLEYGTECYCADVLSNGASLSSTSGQCNTACGGSSSTTCGGPNALQVYTNANKQTSAGAYSNTGCVQEVSGRLLRGASIAADNMSIETCTSFCQSQGFSIAGLEYGRECYCDNSYFSAPLQSGQCNMNCAGNANENCGGPNALNIFTLGA